MQSDIITFTVVRVEDKSDKLDEDVQSGGSDELVLADHVIVVMASPVVRVSWVCEGRECVREEVPLLHDVACDGVIAAVTAECFSCADRPRIGTKRQG